MRRLLLAALLCGCADWPRYAHLPGDTAGRIEAEGSASFAWASSSAPAEPGDNAARLVAVELLTQGQGDVRDAELEGTGWEYGGTATRESACDHVSAFPPGDEGFYLYDVDWRVVTVEEPTRLCSVFTLEEAVAQVDVVPFLLDTCGIPYEPLRHGQGAQKGQVVGFGVLDDENRWAVDIDAGGSIGIAAAAWTPTDATNVPAYRWGLAAVAPSDDAPDAALCPDLPEGEP